MRGSAVGKPEVAAQMGSFGDYFGLPRHPFRTGEQVPTFYNAT